MHSSKTGDIKDPRLLYAKGGLFLSLGLIASALLLLQAPRFSILVVHAIAVWSFARAYYFAFYVIEHYIDPTFRFSGLTDFVKYLVRRNNDDPSSHSD